MINKSIRPYIVLNGISSQTIKGLLITDLPPISKPPIRVNQEEIDGRDGDIITPLGYSAYDKTLSIGLTYEYDIDDIIEFFNSEGKVVFSNEPDKYYKYAIYEQIDFEKLVRFKKADVVFHIQPFKYSDDENEKTFTLGGDNKEFDIRNNGNIYSKPTLEITGAGNIEMFLNGSSILTIDLPTLTQTIIIDTVEMNAYNENKTVFLNRLVEGDYDNIRLKVGKNTISFIGGVNKVVVNNYSRWI